MRDRQVEQTKSKFWRLAKNTILIVLLMSLTGMWYANQPNRFILMSGLNSNPDPETHQTERKPENTSDLHDPNNLPWCDEIQKEQLGSDAPTPIPDFSARAKCKVRGTILKFEGDGDEWRRQGGTLSASWHRKTSVPTSGLNSNPDPETDSTEPKPENTFDLDDPNNLPWCDEIQKEQLGSEAATPIPDFSARAKCKLRTTIHKYEGDGDEWRRQGGPLHGPVGPAGYFQGQKNSK